MRSFRAQAARFDDESVAVDFLADKAREFVGRVRDDFRAVPREPVRHLRAFDDLDKYITQDALRALSEDYKKIAGFAVADVAR